SSTPHTHKGKGKKKKKKNEKEEKSELLLTLPTSPPGTGSAATVLGAPRVGKRHKARKICLVSMPPRTPGYAKIRKHMHSDTLAEQVQQMKQKAQVC
uniref:Uncharacterized protein n=1 Tax=Apteryx owenii TaxID=8824 RepID=A0A8B9NRE2_APTOW